MKIIKSLSSVEEQYTEGNSDIVAPNHQSSENIVIISPDFKDDVDALEKFIGIKLSSGLLITVSLTEMHSILPRNRKKVGAYNTLARYLKDELDVELVVTSKKTRR